MIAPKPKNEIERIKALNEYRILDTMPEAEYNDIVKLASTICQTPIAVISLVDEERQWFKAKEGVDVDETPRDIAFCAHAILEPEKPFIVPNAKEDPRFENNEMVTGKQQIRFYAGQHLISDSGHPIGMLCVKDTTPRELTEEQIEALRILSHQTVQMLELRKSRNIYKLISEELKKLNQELSRSNKELEQFAYIASHDLQQPLRAIGVFTEKLEEKLEGNLEENTERYMQFIKGGVRDMHELIQGLLAYSRVNNSELELEECNTQEILDTVIGNLKDQIEEHDVTINTSKTPIVPHNKILLTQLLQNLIENAIKYRGEDKPEISVQSEKNEGAWSFSVKDNGMGIEDRHQERIFEMFQRLHRKEDISGTGIGLALCKKITERYGGTMSVTSAPGKGSTFTFTVVDT